MKQYQLIQHIDCIQAMAQELINECVVLKQKIKDQENLET